MGQKITRRVVLGTAIAGLAAGPFVIRTLRKPELKPESDLFTGFTLDEVRDRFFTEWKGCIELFDVSTSRSASRSPLLLKPDFSLKQNLNYLALSSTVVGVISSIKECTPENLLLFSNSNGKVSISGEPEKIFRLKISENFVKSIALDQSVSNNSDIEIFESKREEKNGVVYITKDVKVTTDSNGVESSPTKISSQQGNIGEFSLIDKDDNLFFEDSKGQLTCVSDFGYLLQNPLSAEFFPSVANLCPEVELSIGKAFDIPTHLILSGFPNKALVDSIVNINGSDAAKIIGEQTMSAAESIQQCEELRETYRKHNDEIVEWIDSKIRFYSENKLSSFKKVNSYVDIHTGIVLRQEFLLGHQEITPWSTTHHFIMQLT